MTNRRAEQKTNRQLKCDLRCLCMKYLTATYVIIQQQERTGNIPNLNNNVIIIVVVLLLRRLPLGPLSGRRINNLRSVTCF